MEAEVTFDGIDQLAEVLELAVLKYEFRVAGPIMRRYLHDYLDTDAGDLARKAARHSLKLSLPCVLGNTTPQLRHIPANLYHALLRYHDACSSVSGSLGLLVLSSRTWAWMICTNDSCSAPKTLLNQTRNAPPPKAWIFDYMDRAKAALKETPGASVSDIVFLAPTITKLASCNSCICATIGVRDLANFINHEYLPRLQQALDKVPLELRCVPACFDSAIAGRDLPLNLSRDFSEGTTMEWISAWAKARTGPARGIVDMRKFIFKQASGCTPARGKRSSPATVLKASKDIFSTQFLSEQALPPFFVFKMMSDAWFAISQLWVSTLFYGIYLVLFCICVYILLHRPHTPGNTILLVTAIALFTLSTVQTVICLILGSIYIDDLNLPFDKLVTANTILYAVNNTIADGLLVFGIGFKLRIVKDNFIFFMLSLITNVLVTILTATRIWWIQRKARAYLQPSVRRRYASTIAILIESGVIYSVFVLAYLIVDAFPETAIMDEPLFQLLAQVMGIAPTLIIVRVGLGVAVEGADSRGTVAAPSIVPPKQSSLGTTDGNLSDNDVFTLSSDLEMGSPRVVASGT
ncbi:hypothetical protein B0H16DRAFT_1842729 [Mycena metata]|uniref:Uncharacterized protein n=1 Tax=Mycena metata TaxID=1033252 RepID=A0AAD7IU92_9AGAR|nr:hypothetical protein B0H16DRAFT_1842729 [Mycena metata]